MLNDVEFLDDDDDLPALDFIFNGLPRQVYIRNNYFDTYDEASYRKRFRLSKNCTLELLVLIEDRLEFPYDGNNCVSPINQLLVCLRYYSTGGHLQTIADFAGMHLSTVSRIIVRVSEAIASLHNQYIRLENANEYIRKTQQQFFDVAAFPRVLGVIDCTHIKLQSPGGDDAEVFRNRKRYFSLNVQMVCDSKLIIQNVVARWPGSSHDATIFTHSNLRRQFENRLFPNCLLLGDSGYSNKSYLLTPLLNPANETEQLYNEAHIRTRNAIERCFGVLKRRFPVLAYECRLKLNTVMSIIVASSVLHNIAIQMGDVNVPPLPDELDEHVLNHLIRDGQIPQIQPTVNEHPGVGVQLRRQFIQNYFGNINQ